MLIHKRIQINQSLGHDPFSYLVSLTVPANSSLSGKTQYLKDFCVTIQSIEESTEQVFTRNHWLSITSGFSAAMAVAGSSAMIPLAGILVSGAAVVAAAVAIADACLTKAKLEPITEQLTRHRIALESQKTIHWAALWEISGTDLFCKAVSYSARGFLSEGKLVQQGQDPPFVRAVDYAAEALGATYDAVIDAVDAAIAGRQAPQLQKAHNPITLPQSSPRPLPVADEFVADAAPTLIQSYTYQPIAPTQLQPKPVRSTFTLLLNNPFQSLAIFGAQRTGKSYLAAILSQELNRRGIPVYVINLARFGEEDDVYWCHCAKAVLGDISSMKPYEANQLIKEAIRTVHEFYAQSNAILIFDEWAYAGNKDSMHAEALEPLLKLVADKLGTLTSTGIKRGKAIWTIAPEFVAGSLQKPALSIKKSALLYVTIAPGEFVEWRGNRIGFNAELFSQIKNNYTIEKPEGIFDQERICYLNNEWIEMGELPPLDPNLRSSIVPVSVSAPTPSPQLTSSDYSDEDKQAAQSAMVAALRVTPHHTLWEFARDEVGCESAEQIKELLEAIADLIFEYDLVELKDKFRLRGKTDVRYSYAGYSRKVAQTHQFTGNICCCCLGKPSQQAHHVEYFGADDEPGKNMKPVCIPCHETQCHGDRNWNRTGVWTSHNTDGFKALLDAGFQSLATKNTK